MAGKFIVIDGTDGSGKATQTDLLVQKLTTAGLEVKKITFPQYNKKSAGAVEEYLSGKYGSAEQVSPYTASLFFAVDRYDASFTIRQWLAEGKVVIADRYTTANLGHQGAKFKSDQDLKKFISWLDDLEYNILKIPRPDLTIILHLPADVSQNLAQQRENRDWADKTRDIHEEDIVHLQAAEKTYLQIVNQLPNCSLIECANNNQPLTREVIAEQVWAKVEKLLK